MATLVVKLGGNVVLDPAQVAAVAAELKGLQAAGHRVVVVHGGGPQLDAAIGALGETVQKIDGLRVTSRAAADVVLRVMDEIGASLAKALSGHGLLAHHVAAQGRTLEATPKRVSAGDLGRVGTVTRFLAAQLPPAAAGIAVVTPVGFDAQGPLNVNADEGACAVAWSLRAAWLVLGTDVAAVRGETGESLGRLTPRDARKLLQGTAASGGMIPKLNAAVAALGNGVGKVLITKVQPGTLTRSILEGKPEGTLVENDLAVA